MFQLGTIGLKNIGGLYKEVAADLSNQGLLALENIGGLYKGVDLSDGCGQDCCSFTCWKKIF